MAKFFGKMQKGGKEGRFVGKRRRIFWESAEAYLRFPTRGIPLFWESTEFWESADGKAQKVSHKAQKILALVVGIWESADSRWAVGESAETPFQGGSTGKTQMVVPGKRRFHLGIINS